LTVTAPSWSQPAAIHPAALVLPPTQPIDLTEMIVAQLARR
jgi:hypothetical protein